MKANINGVVVEGTPGEIAKVLQLCSQNHFYDSKEDEENGIINEAVLSFLGEMLGEEVPQCKKKKEAPCCPVARETIIHYHPPVIITQPSVANPPQMPCIPTPVWY